MCGGRRTISCRSAPGVSPVRTRVRISTSGRHARSSARRISAGGSARVFWTSFESALSGETYTTWVSWASVPSSPWRRSVSMAARKAAKVFPDPVGAAIKAFLPAAVSGQARRCGSVGSRKRDSNQRAITGWKPDRDMIEIWRRFPEVATGLAAQYSLHGDPSRRRYALDGLTDLVVGRRGSRSNSHCHRSLREPACSALLRLPAHGAEADGARLGIDARRVLDVVGRRLLVTDRREVRGVARVIPADHHHEVERLRDELQHRVLAILRCRADGVERPEVLRQRSVAVAFGHALSNLGRDREALARKHGGLIRHAHAHEVAIRVEPRGHLACKEPNEPLPAPRSLYVGAQLAGFSHVAHHHVFPPAVFAHLASRGLRFLVVILAMDDCGEAVFCIRFDALPHVQHRATRRVHEHAADRPQSLEILHRDAERRQDDDIGRRDVGKIELAVVGPPEELHAHRLQLLVDVGIVDDLAHQKDLPLGKLGARLVGVFHGAVHAVTEAELARQLEGQIAGGQDIAPGADLVHHSAVVVRRQRPFDMALEPEAPSKVGLLHAVNLTARHSPRARRPSRAARRGRRERSPALPSPARRPISSFVSPVSTSVPSLPVTWAKCPGPCVATVESVTVTAAPPARRNTKLAKSSAVTGRAM